MIEQDKVKICTGGPVAMHDRVKVASDVMTTYDQKNCAS